MYKKRKISAKDLPLGQKGPRLDLLDGILDVRALKLERHGLIFNLKGSNFNRIDPKLHPKDSTLRQNDPTEG
ncbi:hypothetical protein AWE51_22140 [Aquimarina aggregata]|uniref:Uncharacterized protein n=1 Tax=Aquimarina aggregata TaxID=1642818 RepID=A0A162FCY6_9FLAO|nr:hypothetical protein AWE51_22140 [Aquimarina aggregata]